MLAMHIKELVFPPFEGPHQSIHHYTSLQILDFSSTMSKQVIVVFGATGKQGGSVVKSLLKDPRTANQFHVKAVTRDINKDSAKALSALGAELIAVCPLAMLSMLALC